MHTQLTLSQIGSLIEGHCSDPGSILGPHHVDYQGSPAVAVRSFLPDSRAAWVVDHAAGVRRPMRRIHPGGVYEAICPANVAPNIQGKETSLFDSCDSPGYSLQFARPTGEIVDMQDPYAAPSVLTDFDRYLIGEGKHHELYNRMGAHCRKAGANSPAGVNFVVWAPNARTVQVVGDFNSWDGRKTTMRVHPHLGIWELFVSDAKVGDRYKYRIQTEGGEWVDKSDPVGFAAELPPLTASIVADLSIHEWEDQAWMEKRANTDPLVKPFNAYEVHLGSWQQGPGRAHGWLDYRDLAHRLVDYCHRMNFTHVELMPVSEHPFTGSWGYQTVGYFAPTSRHGSPEDFMYFVDYLHQNDLGVIIDWVPAHFPKDGHGLYRFDGSPLYEHADPRQGEHPDWGTMIFNYGRNEVRNFLVANALFWLDKYHIDGLRVDAVASMLYLDYSREGDNWIPNQYGGRENLEAIEFIREFNVAVHEKFPGAVTVAEESTAWPGVSRPIYDGGLGFTFKWNMGWMNDTLRYMRDEPIHRQYHQEELTFSLIYAFTENFVLPLSHDEVVHGKGSLISQMPGDMWQKFANLRLLYSYMWTHPGKKLLFMGGEIAQWTEWHHDHGPQWELLDFETHRGVQNLIADLNKLVIDNPALHACDHTGDGFEWIDCKNKDASVLVYLRKAEGFPTMLVCCNFTPVPRKQYRVGVPTAGYWTEVLNSDAGLYGGTNVGNHPGLQTTGVPSHERPDSVLVNMPPLGVSIFRQEA
ncbi:1,4-alpha-glucan branching enzyme GlgB [Roseimaritima multifibrata]|uniref:1,4-alpha-glucan branching enzyme GlgB n=1 Tax=Roseimaritima multifibrata TaxID=1930274 RepID=A0A517MCS1_9BACT|nr:1,4-alpha-glucan branching protein GlgB [Roseimaritima multifibrata]QDS92689.1 1,4-alpha-glucan branching enzyme GlgB [Roseimaritima multifibrata]